VKRSGLYLLCCALLPLLLGACSGFSVPDLDEAVRRENLVPEQWKPLKLSVGLAPVVADLELDAKKFNVEDTRRWVLTPDDARLNGAENSLQALFLQTLSRYRMFERVELIRGATSKSSMEELRALALAQGLDVVLRPVVRRSDVGYVGTNAAYGWNLALWLVLSPINSWWVADEDFDAFLECDLGLYSTASGAPLKLKRIKPEKPVIKAFDDWDHGFHLFAIFAVPGYFDHENWEKVGSRLMPLAEHETKKETLRFITREVGPAVSGDAFQDGIRRRVGLFIGVDGNGQSGVPLTRFAGADARALAQRLPSMTQEGLVRKASLAVTGEAATRQGVQAALDKLTPLARANDDFFLGYSGVGTLTPEGKPAVLLSRRGGGYEAVALEALVDLALAGKPRTLVLALDCSFISPADGRCAVSAELLAAIQNAPPESLLQPLVERCRKAGSECVILSATGAVPGPGTPEHALELEDLGQGLFTSFLLDGLGGAANTDGVAGVSLEELARYLGPNIERISGFDNKPQKPWLAASPARRSFLLPSAEKKPAER